MKRLTLALVWILAFLQNPANAATIEIKCPAEIRVEESVSIEDKEWSAIQDNGIPGYFLENISIYANHPREGGSLTPDQTASRKLSRKFIWQLRGAPDDSYWVGCSYINSRSLLIQQLPPKVKKCEMTETLWPRGARQGIEKFSCELAS